MWVQSENTNKKGAEVVETIGRSVNNIMLNEAILIYNI